MARESGLAPVGSDRLSLRLAEALSQEYTELSALAHELFTLAQRVEGVDAEHLAVGDPETPLDELRRCEVAMRRLSAALEGLRERLPDHPGGVPAAPVTTAPTPTWSGSAWSGSAV